MDATLTEGSIPGAAETVGVPEARDSREKVLDAFNSAFGAFENYPADKLSPEQLSARDLIKSVKERTLDRDRVSYRNRFTGEDGKEYSQQEYMPVDELIIWLRERVKSGELSPEDEVKYREQERVLHGNAQEYYHGRNKKENSRKMARIRQEAQRIKDDPRLATGNDRDDWLKANDILLQRRELIIPRKKDIVEPPTTPPTDPPPPTNPPPEEIKREVAFVNRTLDVRKRAGEVAEELIRKEMRRGSILNPLNWGRKIGLRVMEEYWRQKLTQQVYTSMLENNNSYLNLDMARSRIGFADVFRRQAGNLTMQTQADIGQEREAGFSAAEKVKLTGNERAGQRVVEAQGALKDMILTGIIRPAVEDGNIDYAQIQQRLRDFVEQNQNDPQVQAVFGRDATQYGRLAEYFASDILETAEVIRQDIAAHKYAIEQLDKVVTVKLANTSWAAETQAQFNRVDKAVAWAERHRISGLIGNPAFIGAAFSIGMYGSMRLLGIGGRAAQIAVPGAGLLPGALLAAARRNYDLKVDMASHQAERAYNMQISQGSSRREALERFAYNTASVDDLINGGGVELVGGQNRESMDYLSRQDLTVESNRQALVRRITEINKRLDFSATNKVDLITFAGRGQVEQGRLALVRAVAQARVALRSAGVAEDVIRADETRFAGEWEGRFTQNKEQQDRSFKWYRVRNAAGAAVFGGVAGFAGGFVSHEVLAGIGGFFEAPKPPVAPPSAPDINTIKSMFPGINAVVDPNGHIAVTGAIPQDVQDEMQRLGFTVNQGPEIPGVSQTITEQRLVSGPDGEWLKNSVNIDHREWYSYNQSGSQLNELRLYTFKEGDTVILDVSKMEEGFQRGLNPGRINVQDVIKNGEAGVFISRPDDPQNGFWVMDKDDGVIDGRVRLDPNAPGKTGEIARMVLNQSALQQLPDGNIATELRGHQDVFNIGANGKPGFIEAGRIVERNGVNVLQDFATIRGTSPIPETVGMPITVTGEPTPTFEIVPPPVPEVMPETEETPFIIPIPFAPRHPLEPIVIPRPEYPYSYYNLGYELFRRPDGRPATLADIVRFRSPEAARDSRIAQLFPQRSPQTGTAMGAVVPESTVSTEGERALAAIRETFLNSPHIYLSFSGAIGDVAINSAYLEGIRQYTQTLGQSKKVTLIVPPNIVPLIEPLSKQLGYEIVTEERYRGVDKARSLIEQQGENNALVLEFDHTAGKPLIDTLPNGGLVVGDLLMTSVGLYDNGRSGSERFSEFFSDLLSIPANQRVSISPRLELPENSDQIFVDLQRKYNIDTNKQQVAIVVEASHQMKRYSLDNWRAIIQQIAQSQPDLEFNFIFNPAGGTYTATQLRNTFRGVPGVRLVSGNLTEQMVMLAHQNLVISNDTGLAHVAAVLENGPNVISLHVPLFPPSTWVAVPKRHQGIMAPFTEEFRSEETDESKKLINKIPPAEVAQKALELLGVTSPAENLEATVSVERSVISGVGFSETQGRRSEMEDAHTMIENNFGGKPNQAFFGIYDGHGGRQVADFAATNLHQNFLSELGSGIEPKQAFKNVYYLTDQQIKDTGLGEQTGSTVLTVFVQGNKLVVANAGDARAVLDRGGQAMRLSQDHKLTDPAARARIERAGGRVTQAENDVPRVEGVLAIARALGDHQFKRFIPVEPFRREEELVSHDTHLILACDGVWDVISDQEAVDLIKNEPDPQKASEILKNEAFNRGSGDNISVMVIKLNVSGSPAEIQSPVSQTPQVDITAEALQPQVSEFEMPFNEWAARERQRNPGASSAELVARHKLVVVQAMRQGLTIPGYNQTRYPELFRSAPVQSPSPQPRAARPGIRERVGNFMQGLRPVNQPQQPTNEARLEQVRRNRQAVIDAAIKKLANDRGITEEQARDELRRMRGS